jgi:restriction endonuclease S subunit
MSNYNISSAFDKDRVFILQKSEIEKRLDPFYYVPSLMELEKKVLAKQPKRLREYVVNISSGATPNRDEEEKYYSDAKNGIPFLRVQNVTEFGLDLSDVKFINNETHEGLLKRSQVFEDDLLVTITGRIASAAVAPKGFIGNINQHSVVIKTRNREISKILACYLNTTIGQKLALRLATGGTRPALDYPALLSIPILNDKRVLEITQKVVEQKKQNEAAAEKLLATIDDYLLKELGITLPAPPENNLNNRMFTVSIRKISGNRFDSPFYQFNWNLMSNKFPMANLADVVQINPPTYFENIMNEEEISFVPMESVSNEGFISVYQKDKIVNSKGYTFFKEGDLLVAKITPCMENGKTAIAKYLHNGFGFGSTEFHVFRKINNQIEIDFLHFLFRTKYFRSISKQQYGGSAGHQRVPPIFFQKLQIPLPPLDTQKEIADHITGIRQQAQQLKENTKEALSKASQEIEKILLA